MSINRGKLPPELVTADVDSAADAWRLGPLAWDRAAAARARIRFNCRSRSHILIWLYDWNHLISPRNCSIRGSRYNPQIVRATFPSHNPTNGGTVPSLANPLPKISAK